MMYILAETKASNQEHQLNLGQTHHRRAHGEILDGPRYITPTQHEANHYDQIAVTETVTT